MDKSRILQALTPYQGKNVLIEQNQNVKHIMDAIVSAHKKYVAEYDRIYKSLILAEQKQPAVSSASDSVEKIAGRMETLASQLESLFQLLDYC
jgi:DNA polymerase III alpha subunit (gram-positive type)